MSSLTKNSCLLCEESSRVGHTVVPVDRHEARFFRKRKSLLQRGSDLGAEQRQHTLR